jgi:hypothetical protein
MSDEPGERRMTRPSRKGPLRRAIADHPVATRWILAGPVALLAALATMAAMPLWLPAGAAGVNAIVLPIVLTPLLWAVPFFYACLEPNLARCAVALSVPTLVQGLLVAAALG